MKITLEDINSYIPKEVTDKLPRKKFNAGEILIRIEDKHVIFLLEGTGHLTRYQNDKKVIYPFIYRKNSVAGFNMLLSARRNNWEFVSSTDGEALILSSEIVEEYIYTNPIALRFFIENAVNISENGLNSYYILSQGGARACLAFLFIEGSEEGRFIFRRYEGFSEALGISKAMLYKITKSFIDEKFIRKEKRCVVILNHQGLRDLYKEYIYS